MALRERLEKVCRLDEAARGRAAELLTIGRDFAVRLDEATRTVDHGELLYDDRGLPQ